VNRLASAPRRERRAADVTAPAEHTVVAQVAQRRGSVSSSMAGALYRSRYKTNVH